MMPPNAKGMQFSKDAKGGKLSSTYKPKGAVMLPPEVNSLIIINILLIIENIYLKNINNLNNDLIHNNLLFIIITTSS